MREACFCGRIGEVEDREPVTTDTGEPALRCPEEACGHTDRLEWLPEETQRMQERFEQELVLSANKSPVRGALPLGAADS